MEIKADYHSHTCYCDGSNTPDEMAKEAYRQGFTYFGFSGHAFYSHPWEFGMDEEKYRSYRKEIAELKTRYAGKMYILAGIELECLGGRELYPGVTADDLEEHMRPEYAIGSCHCIEKNGEYVMVDTSDDMLTDAVNRLWNGDWYALTRDYYETEGKVLEKTGAGIIGHFDLIAKFNQDYCHFNESSDEYLEPALFAMKKLNRAGVPFEINTGAISRGYREEPYPSEILLKELKAMGGKIMINSDSHSVNGIGFQREEAKKLAWKCGFRKVSVLNPWGIMEEIEL